MTSKINCYMEASEPKLVKPSMIKMIGYELKCWNLHILCENGQIKFIIHFICKIDRHNLAVDDYCKWMTAMGRRFTDKKVSYKLNHTLQHFTKNHNSSFGQVTLVLLQFQGIIFRLWTFSLMILIYLK